MCLKDGLSQHSATSIRAMRAERTHAEEKLQEHAIKWLTWFPDSLPLRHNAAHADVPNN